jgi:hypothetical protein
VLTVVLSETIPPLYKDGKEASVKPWYSSVYSFLATCECIGKQAGTIKSIWVYRHS